MKSTYQEAIFRGLASILPQMGFNNFELLHAEECGKNIDLSDITVTIGIDGDLHGNILYTMSEDCAVKIASLMTKKQIKSFDKTTQKMVMKFVTLLTENACAALTGLEVTADTSAPTLMYGNFSVNLYHEHIVHFKTNLNGMLFSIYVSIGDTT